MDHAEYDSGESDSQFQDFIPESKPPKIRINDMASNHVSKDDLDNCNLLSRKAPTMAIEAVHVGRPQKVMAFLANFAALFLYLTSFVSTAWMQTRGIRMGLFHECVKLELYWVIEEFKRLRLPIPETACQMTDCISSLMKLCGAFNLFALLTCFITLVLMGYGMSTVLMPRKFITYNVIIGLNCISMTVVVASMVMYPIFFYLQFEFEGEEKHEHPHGGNVQIGWSLIAAAVAVVLTGLQTILMAVDKSGEEVVYRERILRDEEEEDFEQI